MRTPCEISSTSLDIHSFHCQHSKQRVLYWIHSLWLVLYCNDRFGKSDFRYTSVSNFRVCRYPTTFAKDRPTESCNSIPHTMYVHCSPFTNRLKSTTTQEGCRRHRHLAAVICFGYPAFPVVWFCDFATAAHHLNVPTSSSLGL